MPKMREVIWVSREIRENILSWMKKIYPSLNNILESPFSFHLFKTYHIYIFAEIKVLKEFLPSKMIGDLWDKLRLFLVCFVACGKNKHKTKITLNLLCVNALCPVIMQQNNGISEHSAILLFILIYSNTDYQVM